MLEGIYFPVLDIRDPSIYGNSRVFGDSWFHATAVQGAAKYVIWIAEYRTETAINSANKIAEIIDNPMFLFLPIPAMRAKTPSCR